jgi:hypothetical protein
MSLITIQAGARTGAFLGPDGTYPATLVAIDGPKTITPKGAAPFDLYEWTFAVDGAPDDACLVWTSTSTKSGPKSRMYGFLTALLGRPPAIGQGFDAEDLRGRMAHLALRRDENGFTKVDSLSALPVRMPSPVAAPVPASSPRPIPQPVERPAYRTLREVVEQDDPAGDDGIPF